MAAAVTAGEGIASDRSGCRRCSPRGVLGPPLHPRILCAPQPRPPPPRQINQLLWGPARGWWRAAGGRSWVDPESWVVQWLRLAFPFGDFLSFSSGSPPLSHKGAFRHC